MKSKILFLAFITANTTKQLYFNYILTYECFSHRFFMLNAYITLLITYLLFKFILQTKRFGLWAIVFYLFQLLYMEINLTYFEYFQNYLYASVVFQNIGEGLNASAHFAFPLTIKQLYLLIDLPILVFLLFYNNAPIISINKKIYGAFIIFTIALFGYAAYNDKLPVTMYKSQFSGQIGIVQGYGLATLQILDYIYAKNDVSFTQGDELNSSSNKSFAPNILIIQTESLDAAIINKKHNNVEITPFLNSLTANSIFFPYTLSYHLGGATSDCEFSTINGVHPLANQCSLKLQTYDFNNSVVKIFKQHGYTAVGFHNNEAQFFNRGQAYPKMGFDEFYDINKMNLKRHIWGATDEDTLGYAAKMLKNMPQPYFAYIVTMSSHAPYDFIEYSNSNFDDIKDKRTKNYYNSIQYVDIQLKKFLQKIDLSNTIVVIMGDHTSAIKNKVFTSSSIKTDNGQLEFVPMFILTPDKQIHFEHKNAASFFDIAPTLLTYAGFSFNYKTFGENLMGNNLDKNITLSDTQYSRQELFNIANKQKISHSYF